MACALDAFMPGMATGMALSDLARRGVPMPGWHGQLGDVVPGPAWHYLDGYGEQRAVLATFYYGETPHVLVAVTSPWPVARVLAVQLLRSAGDELRQSITQTIEQRYSGRVVEEPLTPQETARQPAGGGLPHPRRPGPRHRSRPGDPATTTQNPSITDPNPQPAAGSGGRDPARRPRR